MIKRDAMSSYAYFALLKFHILPSVFLNMDRQEKAFVIAAAKEYQKAKKKEADEIKSKPRRH